MVDHVPLVNGTTFTRKNFGFVVLNTSSETDRVLTFSADLGPVETAVFDNRTISQEQLSVDSERPQSTATGALSLPGLDACPQIPENGRIVYSAFRTNALFLTPDTACNQSAIGSIVLGVRKSASTTCHTSSVIVDLQQLNEVYTKHNLMSNGNIIFAGL